MPPLRRPLEERSGNSRCGKDLTLYQRGKIQGMVDKGATPTQTACYYNLPVSIVRSTVNLDVLRNEGVLQL